MTGLSNLRRIRRIDLGAIGAGFSMASLMYWFYLWFGFMDTQPMEPHPAAGLIYPMNNHGWVYYLSATDATQLGMLFTMFFMVFTLSAVVAGPPAIKRPWEKYPMQVTGYGKYLFVSLLGSLVLLRLTSFHMASVLVSSGIILQPI
jgi:hypothetical protein